MTDDKNKANYSSDEIERKLKEEEKRPEDPVPDKDMRKEEKEVERGRTSKNDSSTEEKYDEDLKNKKSNK
ncbi:hypothetical protein LF817_02275 [Halobacillus sp. A1]|uniref:hypothetical protein n=1 Tax=Halobacillus sp. A1 TaxID=2880262 RepID=UPI0020A62BCC|nr:hypothetical protein [Halobacillus sp. A1]MCP3030163.1 hypothetical protein [Halobacillus sp. A1]